MIFIQVCLLALLGLFLFSASLFLRHWSSETAPPLRCNELGRAYVREDARGETGARLQHKGGRRECTWRRGALG